MSRGRRTRPFYRLRVAILGAAILPVACFIGLETLPLMKAYGKGDTFNELIYLSIIGGCVAVIFLLIWGILLQGKSKYRSRSPR